MTGVSSSIGRAASVVVALALMTAACSSGPSTCEEVADEFVVIAQELLDDVEAQVGDASIDEILGSDDGLPNIDRFTEEKDRLDAAADDLGCSVTQMEDLVAERAGLLTAETPIGNLIIEFIATGEL